MADLLLNSETDLSALKQQLAQREAELQIINGVQEGLAANLDMQAIYDLVGDKVRDVFDAQGVQLVRFDHKNRIMYRHYVVEKSQRFYIDPVPINELWSAVIHRGRTWLANDFQNLLHEMDPNFTPPAGEIPQSALFVPMIRQEEMYGVITLFNLDCNNAFDESDARLLETIAHSMSQALENARLFAETQRLLVETEQRNAELAVINSVQEGLASKLDIQGIYELIGEKVREIFNVQVADIVIYDPIANLISMPYSYEKGDRSVIAPQEPYGFRLDVINNRAPLLINQNFAELASQHSNPLITGEWPKSAIFVPLLVDDKAKGVISIQDMDRENAYSDADVRLLQTLANAMSIALENARLFAETQRLLKETEQRAAELQIINSVQQGLATRLDVQAIYDLVGDRIRDIFHAQVVMISTYDRQTETIEHRYAIERGERIYAPGHHPIRGFRIQVVETRQPVLVGTNVAELATQLGQYTIPGTMTPKTWLGVPMIVGDQVTGILSLQDVDQENAFGESVVRLLQTLAASMSVALENARLWEQENLYRQALEREFEIGRDIQAGFLPRTLPQPEGWEIAASLKSAREVAGDFYDVFYLSENKVGLVIADVCDKGLGAALFMTLFRSLLRAVSNIDFYAQVKSNDEISSEARLKNAISLTNNYIAETHGGTGMFATVFFGILDLRAGALTYINGGHLPPMLLNKNGVKQTLELTGPAVGAVHGVNYSIREVEMDRGDLLFAYTDGLTDTENPAGEFFSEKRLIPFLLGDQPLQPLLKQIQKQVEDHAAGVKQFDDITMLALRRA
jgi:serine phosphatase RsbU (regulator of sigma subunit)/uncharacterized protein YigA (DUF484 family)